MEIQTINTTRPGALSNERQGRKERKPVRTPARKWPKGWSIEIINWMDKEAKAEGQTEREDVHGLEVLIVVKNRCFESMGVRRQQGCGQRGGVCRHDC